MSDDLSTFLDNLEDSSIKDVSSQDQFNTLSQVLNLDAKSSSLIKEIIDSLKGDLFKNLKNTSNETIKRFNNNFFLNYYNAFLKHQQNPQDKALLLYLKFGHISNELISSDVNDFIINNLKLDEASENIIPLYHWLKMILTNQEQPCRSELGINYEKAIRDRYKKMSRKEKEHWDGISKDQKAKDKVSYELNNAIRVIMGMANTSKAIPHTLLGGLFAKAEHNFVSVSKLSKLIREIRKIDFSVFYRETVYHPNNNSTEIINKEVEPYFILLPICGDKVVFWEEYCGNKKSTRGRIFVPIFFTGNLRASMIQALAAFRWELCRSTKGALWTDAVEGGLTGMFYDHVTFYKKNTKLSFEAKEKLGQLIRDNRKEPKRLFMYYYNLWIEYESKGIMKMDKICRQIFFKHLPFSSQIRDELNRIPIYHELINKYNNICQRNINRLEIRYKSRKNEQGELPKELLDNLSFYRY